MYSLYLANFKTRRKTRREYLGITLDEADRERAMRSKRNKQPWMQAGLDELGIDVLVRTIPGKQAALAMEALYTAKRMVCSWHTVRGGPWVLPTLSDGDKAEVRACSCCESLPEIFALVDQFPDGHLADHLKDLRYKPETGRAPAVTAPRVEPATAMKAHGLHHSVAMKVNQRGTPKAPAMNDMHQVISAPFAVTPRVFKCCKKDVLKVSKQRMSGTTRSKKKESGSARRVRLGLTGGAFQKDKYGHYPAESHALHDKTWREKQAMKRPAAQN